jgi:hypothetical protein
MMRSRIGNWLALAGVVLALTCADAVTAQAQVQSNHSGDSGPVSRKKAMAASFLLPGWGQHMAGAHTRGNVFLAAEATILISIISNRVQGSINKNRYIEYAGDFGGISSPDGHTDGYYQKVGSYVSSEEYVLSLRKTARALYGNDLEAREQYVDHYRPDPSEAWHWPSDAYREKYRDIRKQSRNAYSNSDLLLGVALINRILSAMDAARLVHKMNKKGAIYATMEDDVGYLGVQFTFD